MVTAWLVKLRIVPWLGDVKIEELKRSHLNEFYQRIIKEGRFDKRKEKKDSDSDEDTPLKKLPIGKETILYSFNVVP